MQILTTARPERTTSRGLRAFAVRAAFSLWALAVTVPGVYMLAGHVLTLPVPDDADPSVAAAVDATRTPADRGSILAVHVMYQECGCSQRLMTYLVGRGAMKGVRERIVLVGQDEALGQRATSAGFAFEELDADTLARRYRAESAPMLLVASAAGKLLYAGGYSDRKRGPETKDVDVLRAAQRGERAARLPLYGCAVSRELQGKLDPLRLKYPGATP